MEASVPSSGPQRGPPLTIWCLLVLAKKVSWLSLPRNLWGVEVQSSSTCRGTLTGVHMERAHSWPHPTPSTPFWRQEVTVGSLDSPETPHTGWAEGKVVGEPSTCPPGSEHGINGLMGGVWRWPVWTDDGPQDLGKSPRPGRRCSAWAVRLPGSPQCWSPTRVPTTPDISLVCRLGLYHAHGRGPPPCPPWKRGTWPRRPCPPTADLRLSRKQP